jgi:hypothetical protein
MINRAIVLISFLFALAGCATTPLPSGSNPLQCQLCEAHPNSQCCPLCHSITCPR